MSYNKLLLAILLTVVFALASLCQDEAITAEGENPKTTILIDEFGRQGDCELSARVDNFFIKLNENENATGYVITYKGTDFLPSEMKNSPMIARIRRNMAFRRYDDSRIVFIDGGFRETVTTELYLVPEGASPPEPKDPIPAPEPPSGTFLWSRSWLQMEESYQDLSEFILPSVQARLDEEEKLAALEQATETGSNDETDATSEIESSEPQSGDAGNDLEDPSLTPEQIREMKFAWADLKFGDEIASRKKSHGVMVFYVDDEYYDVAKVSRFVEEGRDVIAAAANIGPKQIHVVFGGYGSSKVEYYVVPKGGKAPEPKPETREVEPTDES